jgi:beta-lactamase regulating signal transducer with metallopeptidase domain/predicted  nucleic acid-binding Zn-ribbon protein
MTILLILVKSSLLLAAALTAAWVLRRSPAATRHALWSGAFVSLLALPLLGLAVPALHVPVPAAWGASSAADTAMHEKMVSAGRPVGSAATTHGAAIVSGQDVLTNAAPAVRVARILPSPGTAAMIVWLAGALMAAGLLVLSLTRALRLTRTSSVMPDDDWRAESAAMAVRLGLRRTPRLVMNSGVRTPMAGGIWHPIVFLPAGAAQWSAERRDVVLAHELSHLATRDPLRHVTARLALACYWFHPLAWMAAAQSTLAREQACDDAVLALGVRPSSYARVLLDLADSAPPSMRAAVALPMIERSLLEKRLMAILDHDRRPLRVAHPWLSAACAALIVLSLAAAQPGAAPATQATSGAAIATPPRAGAPPAALDILTRRAPSLARPATIAAWVTGESACWDGGGHDSFSGSISTDDRGSIVRRVGTSGGDRVIEERFGDLRVCMIAEQMPATAADRPSAWPGHAARTILRSSGAGGATLELRASGNSQTWRVNGTERPFDGAAQAWRNAMFAVLDQVWDIATLRGEVSTLRGQISTIRGDESTLRGRISSIRGEVSTMRGQQSTLRGDESTLRGQISSIEGHLSSLRGEISSEQGAISSLNADRYGVNAAERDRLATQIAAHNAEIARLEREIRDYDAAARIAALDKQLQSLDTGRKVAAVEDQIRTFDEAARTAAIEQQIRALDVERRIAEIEKRIDGLDADRRTRQMQGTLDEAIKRLEQAIKAIR